MNNLTPEQKEQVERSGVKARDNEVRRNTVKGAYTAEQLQERAALVESGISEAEIDDAAGASDFDTLLKFARDNKNTDVEAAIHDEYAAALEQTGGDVKQAKILAQRMFEESGGMDMFSNEERDEVKNLQGRNRTDSLRLLHGFKGMQDGVLRAKAGGYYERVGAVGTKGVNRSSMMAATNDLFDQLGRMGSVKRSDGSRIEESELAEIRDKYEQMMESGDYGGANKYIEDFVAGLSDTTRNRVYASAKDNVYNTDKNLDRQHMSRHGQLGIKQREIVAEGMEGVSEDGARILQKLQLQAVQETDPEKRAKIIAEINARREEAEKESQSDVEKAVKAFMDQDWTGLAAILKSSNIEMDKFIDALKRLAQAQGAIATDVEEEANAGKSKPSKKEKDKDKGDGGKGGNDGDMKLLLQRLDTLCVLMEQYVPNNGWYGNP